MNSEIILDVATKTLADTMSFPEAVGKLIGEYYHVDYVRLRKTCYSAEGKTVTIPIAYEGLPPIAPELVALRTNILDSQRNGQKYQDFTQRAMAGGVQGYIAFLRGKRVTYLGRIGDQQHGMVSGCNPD